MIETQCFHMLLRLFHQSSMRMYVSAPASFPSLPSLSTSPAQPIHSKSKNSFPYPSLGCDLLVVGTAPPSRAGPVKLVFEHLNPSQARAFQQGLNDSKYETQIFFFFKSCSLCVRRRNAVRVQYRDLNRCMT